MAEAGAISCDMAEELSRQLEDILSTYCHEDGGVGGKNAVVANCMEVNGLSEKENGKQEEAKLNGNVCVEKDQKKLQEKKKVKGLGELVTHICLNFTLFGTIMHTTNRLNIINTFIQLGCIKLAVKFLVFQINAVLLKKGSCKNVLLQKY